MQGESNYGHMTTVEQRGKFNCQDILMVGTVGKERLMPSIPQKLTAQKEKFSCHDIVMTALDGKEDDRAIGQGAKV